MPNPLNKINSTVTNLPVVTVDDSGNESVNGNMTVGGAVYLKAQGTAPVQQPGQVALYTADGVSVTYVGAGGQAVSQTVSGQTVNGNLVVSGANATGLVDITNTTTTTAPDVNLVEASSASLAYGVMVAADTNERWQVDATGKQAWGPGNGATDTNLYRASSATLKTDNTFNAAVNLRAGNNLEVGSLTSLGDNGAGEIQLADATTIPTTNPTAGVAVYSESGATTPIKIRDTAGNVRSMVDGYFQLTTNPTFTSASQTATTVLLAVQANATYLMECQLIISNTTGATTPSWTGPAGATMQWNDTTTSGDYSSTIGATNNSFPLLATPRMIFLKGILITAGSSGNLTLTLGVSAGTTTLQSGTNLRLTRVK